MTKKETLYKNIKKHGDNLKAIFKIDIDSIKLCKMLFRLESKAHQLATDFCNGDINQIEWDEKGYALKIDDKYIRDKTIHRDWGGYGIIAPDFREGA